MCRVVLMIAVLLPTHAISQDKNYVDVSGVTGSATLTDNKTLADVQQEALKEAKVKALRKAGISENITKNQILITEQSDNEFRQSFNEISQVELDGAITDWEIIEQSKKIDLNDDLIVKITINARVIKYKSRNDPSFNAKLEGFSAVYEVGEPVKFSIRPTKNAYMTIFNFSEDYAQVIYPLNFHQNSYLLKGHTYHAPFTEDLSNYKAELAHDKTMESNRLVVVLTREKINFNWSNEISGNLAKETKTSMKQVLSWINRIEPKNRQVFYRSYIVKR